MLARLEPLGVRIEIDDFGTGYSSLKYLHRFPVDGLKLGNFFVDKLDYEESAAIVQAMISLAHTLYLEVVAESMETPAQPARLGYLGCDTGQISHFGRSVPWTAATEIPETVSAPLTPPLPEGSHQRSHRSTGPTTSGRATLMRVDEWIKVGSAPNETSAMMMTGILEDFDIPALIRRGAGFDIPDFLSAGPRDVLVPYDFFEEARQVLEDTTGLGSWAP